MMGIKCPCDIQKTGLVEKTGSVGLEFREDKSQATQRDFTNHTQVTLGIEDRPGSSSGEHPRSRLDEDFSKSNLKYNRLSHIKKKVLTNHLTGSSKRRSRLRTELRRISIFKGLAEKKQPEE